MSKAAELIKRVKKDLGDSVVQLGTKDFVDTPRLPTGIFALDLAMGGGFPMGRVSIAYGPESCLDADTFIQYEIKALDGRRQNHKGGTIETLYHRFNGLPRAGVGCYQRASTASSLFTAPCMNEEGRIFHNRITGVYDAGEKQCFELITLSGHRIVATADHKFHVGSGYVSLGELSVGSTVLIHNKTPYTGRSITSSYRKVAYVKNHPYGSVHDSGGYLYKRLFVSRLVMEAYLNGMDYESYKLRLNSGDLSGLVFLNPEQHVHHIDEDYDNNDLSNLVVVDASTHSKFHALENHNNLRFMAIEDEVVSITTVGVRRTYDVEMESPYNNFVADGFVVHNSNKTNTVLCAIAQGQLMYPDKVAVFIDVEHGLDLEWASKLGVNPERLIVIHPEFAEQAADLTETFLYAEDVFCVALDSIAALTTQNEIESSTEKASVGGASLITGKLFRKVTVSFNKMRNQGLLPPAFIAINQIRHKIGVMFGNPETQPGGNAPKYAASMIVRLYGKNVMDKKINPVMPALKEVNAVLQKWKVPILSVNAVYSMNMLDSGAMKIGQCQDWNTVSAYLKELDYLSKGDKGGWVMFGTTYKTLDECKSALYDNPEFLQEVKATIISELLERGALAPTHEEESQEEE